MLTSLLVKVPCHLQCLVGPGAEWKARDSAAECRKPLSFAALPCDRTRWLGTGANSPGALGCVPLPQWWHLLMTSDGNFPQNNCNENLKKRKGTFLNHKAGCPKSLACLVLVCKTFLLTCIFNERMKSMGWGTSLCRR